MASVAEPRRDFEHFFCYPMAGVLGAEVSGIQLNGELTTEQLAALHAALLEYKVLFFREQAMDNDDHAAFARLVGTPVDADFIPSLDGYPMMTSQRYDENSRMGSDVSFHHDDSFHKYPTKMSILRALEVPDHGGDTIWVDMEKVLESLSPALQEFLEGKTCEHSLTKGFGRTMLEQSSGAAFDKMMKRNPPHHHPLVVRHPETGCKSLYVSELLANRINELSQEESDLLLEYLCAKAYQPEFACRFRWEKGSVAWWDNRNTIHRGVDDFYPVVRVMNRIAIADEQQPSLHPDKQPRRDFSNLDIVPCNSLDDEPDEQAGDADQEGVDQAFLDNLNRKHASIRFTGEASVRLKSIPAMFRGAAVSAVLEEAEKQGVSLVDDAVLDKVQGDR